MPATSIYMIQKLDGSFRRARKAPTSPRYVFEGVDGDEEANTVTYWYVRATEY